ncbi:MAG: ArnT family glycosyltransferase [Planctomycetaceae bacterium]
MSASTDAAQASRLSYGLWLLPALLFVLCVLPYSLAYLKYHPDERHYTDAALEMLQSGDYLTPRTQTGELRFKKPILTYWLIAGSYHLFGVSPLSSRIPFVLLGAAIIGLTYRLGLKVLHSREAAWLATLIVAVHPTLVIASSQSIPDVVLSISLLMGLLGFCELFMDRRQSATSYWLAYGGLGLGVLAKGIPAVAFAAIALGASLWFGEWSDRQRRWKHSLALTMTAIGTAAWFLLVYWQHGDVMLDEFLHDQVLDRGHRVWWQPLIHLPQVLGMAVVSFLPWTAWFLFPGRKMKDCLTATPSACARRVGNDEDAHADGAGVKQARETRGLLMLWVWSGAYLLLASGVDFINLRYQVVVIPALSILLASRLMALPAALLELGLRRQARLMTGALVVTLGVCFALVAALSGVSWSLMAFVTGTLAWVIWAWHVIPRCGSQSVGLCGAISMMLLLPCGYFGMEAACPPTIEEQVDRKFSAKSLEHQTLWVVGEPVYASRLRVVSSGKLSVKFLPGNDLAPIAADTEASLILFAARTWPTDISRQFEVIQVLPILDVTFPQLFRATFRGDLPEYLGQSQRWAYLAVRRVNGNR